MHSKRDAFITLVLLLGLLGAPVSFAAPRPQSAAPSPAVYFDSAKVAAALAKGASLLPADASRNYQVRINSMLFEKPMVPEAHTLTSHILYVLDGTGNVITGGTLVGSNTTAPNEFRGTAIEGGDVHRASKGDIIIIPNGIPHVYTEAQKGVTFTFLVISIKSPEQK